ncbi:MAG TPA: 4Fe-4S dicluster domain-containing protein [Candidatus Limnocylindria bacterium]|nr:4Fe-4S dicluster domain-containing protein [Candidatus Limnocylindria bacterium]
MNEPEITPRAPLDAEAAGAPPDEPISRRRLVAGGIAAIGAAAVAAATFGRAASAVTSQLPLSKAVVVSDPSLCVGCLACEVNCSTWHASVGRSAEPRIRIMATSQVKLRAELAAFLPSRSGYTPATCKQCPTPWCVENCPTDAFLIDPVTGNRYIDEKACIACGKCEVDCPVEWTGTLAHKGEAISSKRVSFDATKNVFTKCDLCIGREGGPICVERCPVNVAIKAGYVRSDTMCLELRAATPEQFERTV